MGLMLLLEVWPWRYFVLRIFYAAKLTNATPLTKAQLESTVLQMKKIN